MANVTIDMSMPSGHKRMTVYYDNGDIEYLYVAHGSGSNDPVNPAYATKFSNRPNSHCTCLGHFITLDTYYGHNGLSLRIQGLDVGVNDNTLARDIVIHAAEYATEEWVQEHGRCGNSWGCFAIDPKALQRVIEGIKNGAHIIVTA